MVHHKVAEEENALHHVVQKHGCKLLRQDLYRYVAVSESVLGGVKLLHTVAQFRDISNWVSNALAVRWVEKLAR